MSETRRQLDGSALGTPEFIEPRTTMIPEGWFTMGSDDGRDDEKPAHRVWVDAFALGIHQVTRAEYACFLRQSERAAPPFWHDPNFQELRQPVVGPSWFEAVAFCEWMSNNTGRKYRLPTEAEWERAARGGIEGQLYSWGNGAPENLPDYSIRWKNGPECVGIYTANSYGLFNMGDNVHEWCSDWYDARYYEHSPNRNPHGAEQGSRRASRGGAWRHHIKVSRCAARSSIPPGFQYSDYGFRVALTV
ncbi:MAG TPA: SUMF1/EgtB/PvdO family nonheme iron enzyme [Candidatus Acidoferrales bacterium]|nr:SUMF1/EgtB/PvdO family nonheme iron enzyme [Candidatus Acidoferrales bacterium]